MRGEEKIILAMFNSESTRLFLRELAQLGVELLDEKHVFCG